MRNPTHTYRSSTSFHKRWLRFMGIRTDDAWRWSRWCRDTYNFHKNWSEPMRIIWKLIGDRLGRIYRSTKKSSTILPGQASATLSRTKLDRWRPPAADFTPWTTPLIRPRRRKLHMSNTRSHSGSNNSSNNSSSNSLRTRLPKAANEAIGHPSASQPTPPAAANLANRDQTDTAIQVAEDNRQAYHQHHGSQRKSAKAEVQPANAYDADLRTTRRTSAPNTHEVTHRSRTGH